MKKKYLIILAIVFVLFFILYKLNQDEFVVEERDGIKIVNYSVIFPAHVGGYNSLFYGNKKICKDIFYLIPNRFLLSEKKDLILYINAEDYNAHSNMKYEIYNIETNKKITFPPEVLSQVQMVGLNDKVEWFEDKVILSNENQKDILNLKDGTIRIEKIK